MSTKEGLHICGVALRKKGLIMAPLQQLSTLRARRWAAIALISWGALVAGVCGAPTRVAAQVGMLYNTYEEAMKAAAHDVRNKTLESGNTIEYGTVVYQPEGSHQYTYFEPKAGTAGSVFLGDLVSQAESLGTPKGRVHSHDTAGRDDSILPYLLSPTDNKLSEASRIPTLMVADGPDTVCVGYWVPNAEDPKAGEGFGGCIGKPEEEQEKDLPTCEDRVYQAVYDCSAVPGGRVNKFHCSNPVTDWAYECTACIDAISGVGSGSGSGSGSGEICGADDK
jgi:hypothetical protein